MISIVARYCFNLIQQKEELSFNLTPRIFLRCGIFFA